MTIRGIEGLRGREPIGAAVTIGVKGSSGAPVEKDRFHVVEPHERDNRRALHAAFAAFNEADPVKRRTLHGNIVHATAPECWEYHLAAQILEKGGRKLVHPQRRPVCVGNEIVAERWGGKDPDVFKSIACPGQRCEYRQPDASKRGPLCKPWMRFLFRIRWADPAFASLPPMVAKFTSGSWNTVGNFKGFFEQIDKQATQLGVEEFSLYGFPFVLTLTERTNKTRRSRFPVVTITPEADIVVFLADQRQKIADIRSLAPVAALTDPEQQSVDVIGSDRLAISGPVTMGGKDR